MDDWDDLDEAAVEECMILATQMCADEKIESKPPTTTNNLSKFGGNDGFNNNSNCSYKKTQISSSNAVLSKSKITFEDNDILSKQGEISLLRSELKRKETALEAEKIERCAALDAAERKFKERMAVYQNESEAKSKELKRSIEKLQSELQFKSRECEEMVIKCKKMQHQSDLSISNTPSKKRKLAAGFSDRFDFAVTPKPKRSIEVQTEDIKSPISWSRKKSSLLLHSSSLQLKKTRCLNEVQNGLKSTSERIFSPPNCDDRTTLDVTEMPQCLGKIIERYQRLGNIEPLTDDDVSVICDLRESYSKFIPFKIIELRSPLYDFSSTITTTKDLINYIRAIASLCSISHFGAELCRDEGRCILHNLFLSFNKQLTKDFNDGVHLTKELFKLVDIILFHNPTWLKTWSCNCSTELLHTILNAGLVISCSHDKGLIFLLQANLVYMMYKWHYLDPSWWMKVIGIPRFFKFITIFLDKSKFCDGFDKTSHCNIEDIFEELGELCSQEDL